MREPHSLAANPTTARPRDNHAIAIKSARTRRLKKRLEPFDVIDAEVVDVIKRLTPPADKALGTNTARAILQAQTLRKELLLGKLKAEEVERKLEEADVRTEFEELKCDLGIA